MLIFVSKVSVQYDDSGIKKIDTLGVALVNMDHVLSAERNNGVTTMRFACGDSMHVSDSLEDLKLKQGLS